MFSAVDIAVEIECAEEDWAIVVVTTPIGASPVHFVGRAERFT